MCGSCKDTVLNWFQKHLKYADLENLEILCWFCAGFYHPYDTWFFFDGVQINKHTNKSPNYTECLSDLVLLWNSILSFLNPHLSKSKTSSKNLAQDLLDANVKVASEISYARFLELVLLFERCGFKNYKTEFQSGTESVGHSVKGPF